MPLAAGLLVATLSLAGPKVPTFEGKMGKWAVIAFELQPRFWIAIDKRRAGLLKAWTGGLTAQQGQLRASGSVHMEALDTEPIWFLRIADEPHHPIVSVAKVDASRGELSLSYDVKVKSSKFTIRESFRTRSRGGKVVGFDRAISTNKVPGNWKLYFIYPMGPSEWSPSKAFFEDYTESLHLVGLWTNEVAKFRVTFQK